MYSAEDNEEMMDALLEMIAPEIDGAVLVPDIQRIAKVKQACAQLNSVILEFDPEADIKISLSDLTRTAIIYSAKSDYIDIENMQGFLNGLSVASGCEILSASKGKVEFVVTFNDCFNRIGGI